MMTRKIQEHTKFFMPCRKSAMILTWRTQFGWKVIFLISNAIERPDFARTVLLNISSLIILKSRWSKKIKKICRSSGISCPRQIFYCEVMILFYLHIYSYMIHLLTLGIFLMIITAARLSTKIIVIRSGIAIAVLLIIILSIPILWRISLISAWIR